MPNYNLLPQTRSAIWTRRRLGELDANKEITVVHDEAGLVSSINLHDLDPSFRYYV